MDHALTGYMKFKSVMPIGHNRTFSDIKKSLIKEFQRFKSKPQCITKLKEIKKIPREMVWDFD